MDEEIQRGVLPSHFHFNFPFHFPVSFCRKAKTRVVDEELQGGGGLARFVASLQRGVLPQGSSGA